MVKALQHAVRLWSSAMFVSNGNLPLQQSVTRAILMALPSVSAEELQGGAGGSTLLQTLLAGVQLRFSGTDPGYRRLGTQVAAAFSRVVSPDQALDFGDESSDSGSDWEEVAAQLGRVHVSGVGQAPSEPVAAATGPNPGPGPSVAGSSESAAGEPASPSPRAAPRTVDPGEVVLGDSDSDADSGSGSDDAGSAPGSESDSDSSELEPYDMAGLDEPKGPTLVYLRDFISVLKDKEDADRARSALSLLAQRVRQSLRSKTGTGELKEVALALTRTLLTLEDRYKTPGFGQMRLRALVALAVCEPAGVGPYLTREVYATDRSLAHRLDVLDTLALAARELSGVTDDGSDGADGAQQPPDGPKGRAGAGAGAGAGASPPAGAADASDASPMRQVGRVTKRWGKPSKAPKPPKANEFAPHAAAFFFPLLRGFSSRIAGLDLLDKDLLMLSQLLRVMASLLECARHAPEVPLMAARSLECVWLVRYNDDASVRQGALMCMASILRAATRHTGMLGPGGALAAALSECEAWITTSIKSDPDPSCRRLAASIAHSGALDAARHAVASQEVAEVAHGRRHALQVLG